MVITSSKRTSPSKAVMRDVASIREALTEAKLIERLNKNFLYKHGKESKLLRSRLDVKCTEMHELLNGTKYNYSIGSN